MAMYRFNECLVWRDGNALRVRCPAGPSVKLSVRVGEEEESGMFREGACFFSVVEGAKGEPGPNPFEESKTDRNYANFIDFIFVGQTSAREEKVDEKAWLVVETLGRARVFGPEAELPIPSASIGLADWLQVMDEDEHFPDPAPHTPNRPYP